MSHTAHFIRKQRIADVWCTQDLDVTVAAVPESNIPMIVPNDAKSHVYPVPFLLGKIAALAVFTLGVIGLPLALIQVLRLDFAQMPQSLWSQGLLVIVFLTSVLVGGIGINTPPEVGVRNDGLVIEVFLFAHRFIPWCDVLEVRRGTYGLTRISYAIVVVRSGLTLWHALHAIVIGYPGKQVFGVYEHIQGYLELLETIERHLGRCEGP